MRILSALLIAGLGYGSAEGQFTLITTDAAGDAGGELDGTDLHFWYETTQDLVTFRITCPNLASYTSDPAADFSFGLPYGMDGGYPAGTHWTTPGTPVHKISSLYADPGGSPPSNYTFTTFLNNIVVASTPVILCPVDCAVLTLDVPSNYIYVTYNRTDIITDTEFNGNPSATIAVVCNVGHAFGWDDNVSATGTMTLDMATGTTENTATVPMISPNPCNDLLTVQLDGPALAPRWLEINDLSGRNVVRQLLPDAINTYDVSGLAQGSYVAMIFSETGTILTTKVAVE